MFYLFAEKYNFLATRHCTRAITQFTDDKVRHGFLIVDWVTDYGTQRYCELASIITLQEHLET